MCVCVCRNSFSGVHHVTGCRFTSLPDPGCWEFDVLYQKDTACEAVRGVGPWPVSIYISCCVPYAEPPAVFNSSVCLSLCRCLQSASGQSNPLFQSGSARGSPRLGPAHISQPIFVESSATQACKPLVFSRVTTSALKPSRAAPEVSLPSGVCRKLILGATECVFEAIFSLRPAI